MVTRNMVDCEFCEINMHKDEVLISDKYFYIKWDKYPVNPGHALIISKRHISSLSELKSKEASSLFRMLKKAKKIIKEKYHPGGFNFGVNEGRIAGQTIAHLHVHIIPRHKGDVKDPWGGIRNIIPGKGRYPSPKRLRYK